MSLLLNDDQYHQVSLINLATHLGDIFSYNADFNHITKASLTSTQRKKQDPKNIPQEKLRLGLAKYAFSTALGFGSAIAFFGNCALAQVVPDNSLGTQVDPTLAITGGTTVGDTNLFHSFSSFSVPDGAVADFQNATNIVNIFSRVTGGVQSDILGTIQAQGNANFFLLNPSGIAFGPNAELRIGGSFVGTTADGIRFPDGGEFSLTSVVAPNNQLLTVNPSALFFNQTPTGAINNQSTMGLEVGTGQNLFLVGGNINFDGGVVRAPGGRIELGGLAAPGEVTIEDNPDGSNPSLTFPGVRLSFPDDVARADVLIDNDAIVDVVGNNGGDIFINAGNITVSGNSNVCAGIGTNASSCDTPGLGNGGAGSEAGNILFDATGTVSIKQSRIENNVNPGATGNSLRNIFVAIDNEELFGSIIIISAGSFSLTDGAALSTSTFGQGSAGVVFVDSDDSVLVDNSNIFSQVISGATGDAGGILLLGESISLNNSTLQVRTSGTGNAGVAILKVKNVGTVSLNNSTIFSNVESGATGNAGGIRIEAGKIALQNSFLRNEINATGNGGRVELQTNGGTISFDNSIIFSTVESEGVGTGGVIDIQTGSLSVRNGSELQTLIREGGMGIAGLISIKASGEVSLTNSGRIFSTVEQGALGNAGIVNVEAGELTIDGSFDNASGITTSVQGIGNPGFIFIDAEDYISITGAGSGVFSISGSESINFGDRTGGIFLDAGSIFLKDGAEVSVDNQGSGEAGFIFITAWEDIILRNQSTISAVAASGEGGNIFLTSSDFLLLLEGSQINTEAINSTNPNTAGGNIFVATKFIIAAPFNTNEVLTEAIRGSGGNISIFALRLFDIDERAEVFPTNDISAASDFGLDGTVSNNVANVDPISGFTDLPTNPVDPTTLIAETCPTRSSIAEREKNQFIITGQGGLPPDPNAAFPGEAVVNDWEATSEEVEASIEDSSNASPTPVATNAPPSPNLIEAQGWIYGENGEIIFTAQAPNVTPTTLVLNSSSTCNAN